MAAPRWLAGLPVSLALHVVIVTAAVAFLRAERAPTSLIIDLNAIVAAHDDGPGSGAGAPAPAAGKPARGDAPRAAAPPRPSRRVASAPSPTPSSAAEPEPAPLRPVEPPAPEARASNPPQAATRETTPVVPPVALAPPPSAPAGPASGSGSLSAASRSSGPGAADGPTSGVAGNVATGFGGGERVGGGAGDRLAARTPGTGGGAGAGVGSEYAAYLARLRQRIQEGLRYPPVARRRGVSGTVQLEIAIDAAGAIAAVSVIGSSSHEILDRAAVDAARALPRQPFPADVRPRALTVRLPVVFELQ